MADGLKFRSNGVESGQGLLPGIPDEITMSFIGSKLKWGTCNVLQMVSREWRHVICSRRMYDSRRLSDSTEAFLILAYSSRYFFEGCNKRGLTLYSCVDGTFLRLPPIPGAPGTSTHPYFDYICLDGRVYLWEPVDVHNEPPVLWVLDLVGDRRWTMCERERERVKCWRASRHFKIGVLDGKIYRFRGNTRLDQHVLEAGGKDIRQTGRRHFDFQMELLPQTEVYDPHSNVWFNITPKLPIANDASDDDFDDDLECHLTVFSEWEREQVQTDPSMTIRRYEPFYSEWTAWHSTTMAVEKGWCHRHALATQVYDTNFPLGSRNTMESAITEKILLFQEKLVKVIQHRRGRPDMQVLGVDIQAYDLEKKIWELWKSFPAPHGHFDHGWEGHLSNSPGIHSCAFTDNVMWAFVSVRCLDSLNSEVRLMKRPILPISSDSAGWINTSFSMIQFNPNYSEIRPIYL